MTITVRQFGFSTNTGVLANIVDGDAGTGWAPLADKLLAYTAPFALSDGTLNVGNSFAAIEFDFGTPVRVTAFLLQVAHQFTVGAAVLIASDSPASSVANTLQAGDVLVGGYTQEQMVSNHVLLAKNLDTDVAKRYYRLLQRSSAPGAGDGGGGTDGGGGPSAGSNFAMFDAAGANNFVVQSYATLIIEGWGAGASGGTTSMASAGGDTSVTAMSLLAHGGHKSTATTPNGTPTPATGGTASGGNTENTSGQDGGVPDVSGPFSGRGGNSPHGGIGGASVTTGSTSFVMIAGNDGAAPGAGGSGGAVALTHISGPNDADKYPGGAGGGYFKHVFVFGVTSGAPNPGDVISFVVGLGGAPTNSQGAGSNGRIRFSWT